MRAQTAFWPAAALLIVASSLLLMCPLESRAEMRMSPELDEMRKELGELRSRVQELMAAANGGSANELLEKRAMLPYSGGIYGKRAAILPYSGGIYGKRSLLDAAEPYLLNRPSRAVPFNGGIFGR